MKFDPDKFYNMEIIINSLDHTYGWITVYFHRCIFTRVLKNTHTHID